MILVLEGVDGSGKSSIAAQLARLIPRSVIIRGLSVPKIMSWCPRPLAYRLHVLHLALYRIPHAQRAGTTVILDRYIQSLQTYPKYRRCWILSRIVPKPTVFILLTVSASECAQRLARSPDNPYHRSLLANPRLLYGRMRAYELLFQEFQGCKLNIDTSNQGSRQSAELIMQHLKSCHVVSPPSPDDQ